LESGCGEAKVNLHGLVGLLPPYNHQPVVGDHVEDRKEDQRERNADQNDGKREGEDAEGKLQEHVNQGFPGDGVAERLEQPLPRCTLDRIRNGHRPDLGPEEMNRQLSLDPPEQQPRQERRDQDRESNDDDRESRPD